MIPSPTQDHERHPGSRLADSSDEDLYESYSITDWSSDSLRTSRRRPGRSSADEPQRAVLYIQMQLCELTLKQWLATSPRDSTLDANRPYFTQVLPNEGAAQNVWVALHYVQLRLCIATTAVQRPSRNDSCGCERRGA